MNRPPQGWVAWWRARSIEVCAEVVARAEIARLAELAPPLATTPAPVRVPGPARRSKRRVKRKARR